MKIVLLLILLLQPLINFAQSNDKINFAVKSCEYAWNEKDYKPCSVDVSNRIIVYDSKLEQWTLYFHQTEEFKVIHGKTSKLPNTSYDMITYQVIDNKNIPKVFMLLVGSNPDGSKVYKLIKVDKGSTSYTLERI